MGGCAGGDVAAAACGSKVVGQRSDGVAASTGEIGEGGGDSGVAGGAAGRRRGFGGRAAAGDGGDGGSGAAGSAGVVGGVAVKCACRNKSGVGGGGCEHISKTRAAQRSG